MSFLGQKSRFLQIVQSVFRLQDTAGLVTDNVLVEVAIEEI